METYITYLNIRIPKNIYKSSNNKKKRLRSIICPFFPRHSATSYPFSVNLHIGAKTS
jgi:hypothetical protein